MEQRECLATAKENLLSLAQFFVLVRLFFSTMQP